MHGLRSGSVKGIRLSNGKRGDDADGMENCEMDWEASLLGTCRWFFADLGISALVF